MKPLYLQVKDKIFEKILSGEIEDGSTLPTEMSFVSEYRVSRVTIRKALEELKLEGVITSVQGSGTVVSYLKRATGRGRMDRVALIASSTDRFFGIFYEHFDRLAEAEGAFVIFKLNQAEDVLTNPEITEKLILNGIRNFVIWTSRSITDSHLLAKLRGVGCNLVIFDQPHQTLAADTVCLDNEHGIKSLYAELQKYGAKKIALIGALSEDNSVLNYRADFFRSICKPEEEVFSLGPTDHYTSQFIADLVAKLSNSYDGFIFTNCSLVQWLFGKLTPETKKKVLVGAIDFLEELYDENMIFYQQPLDVMAKLSLDCLKKQMLLGRKWHPKVYKVKGCLFYSRNFAHK